MKTSKTVMLYWIAALAIVTGAVSCNKVFDEPPVYQPPNVTATMTIADLKAMHTFGGYEQITTDDVIEGSVVANDSSGNYYKSIVIQDATGGILVNLDDYNLYTSYPVGRKVYVKLKGLYIDDYNRLIEISGGTDGIGGFNGIASPLIDQYVIKGELGNFVAPKVVTVAQLDDSYQNTLIQLDNFEFSATDTSKTYAIGGASPQSVNFTIKSCTPESITLRNSGYADFATLGVPNGNGSITAIYSVYGSTKQLNIRDTSDLKFYGTRCSGGGTGGGAVKYKGGSFSSNLFAKISAYKSGVSTVKTWLVTPSVNLTGVTSPIFNFKTVDGYDDGATLKVYISTNYTGGSTPWTATWTQLTGAIISTGHTSGYAPSFLSSGNLDLSAYTGTVYLAFVYEGSDPSNTTTYEIDDVKVTGSTGDLLSQDFSTVTNGADIALTGWVNAAQ